MRRAHAFYDSANQPWTAAERLWDAAQFTLWDGNLDDGISATMDALAYARKFHVRRTEQQCLALLLAVALIRCDYKQFESILTEVTGEMFWIPMLAAARAETSGDIRHAVKLSPRLDTAGPLWVDMIPQLLGSLARTTYNAGDEVEAKEYLEQWNSALGKVLLTRSGLGTRISAMAAIDECLPALGDAALIRPLYEELVGYEVYRYAPWDGRGLDRVAGALALRLDEVEEAGNLFQAGLAWSVRERCPVEQGRCLQGLAEVAVRRRRRREALRLLDDAIALFEAHGAKLYLDRAAAAREAIVASAHGPISPAPPSYADGLSEREVEVLRLIAAGKSNREIAEDLVLSIRTVERHIENVYAKTGAHTKAQATAYAMQRNLS